MGSLAAQDEPSATRASKRPLAASHCRATGISQAPGHARHLDAPGRDAVALQAVLGATQQPVDERPLKRDATIANRRPTPLAAVPAGVPIPAIRRQYHRRETPSAGELRQPRERLVGTPGFEPGTT